MDNGEVIPSLNEPWTMGGAKVSEWLSGFCMVIIVSELFVSNPSRSMPLLLLIWIGTTFTMAALRKQFPDEERGLANKCLTACGINPPGIPTPAPLQPLWSAAPLRGLEEETEFMYLDLDKLFGVGEEQEEGDIS